MIVFAELPLAPPDSILGLSAEFSKDPRDHKINLTVGVFKTDDGATPVLESVKAAEERLLSREKTKTYLAIEGLPKLLELTTPLVLGDQATRPVAAAQSPGGTGGLRLAADVLAKFNASKRIWISDPTWANHPAIFQAAGLTVEKHPYLAGDGVSGDIPAMLEHLDQHAKSGDAICLHACCHNPTGVDPSHSEWEQIGQLCRDRSLVPLIDFAYQGFGDSLADDRRPVETILKAVPDAIVVASFSKNFGLYSERTGCVYLVAESGADPEPALSQLRSIVRTNYSNPPRHGGAIVAEILGDASLTSQWESEVDAMRGRIDRMRRLFVDGMRAQNSDRDFGFLLDQKGMFSYSGLGPKDAQWLKQEKGIYILGTGRINVAGMNEQTMSYLCESLAECLQRDAAATTPSAGGR